MSGAIGLLRNPRLVLGSISGFGQTGPYASRGGFDLMIQAMSGLMSVTGEPGRGPMRVGTALADLSAGMFAAMGILVALYERCRRNAPGGVGAARLVGLTCQGCHLTIPSTEAERIRKSAEGTVAHCDNCGCILIPG